MPRRARHITLNKDNLLIFDINSLLTGRGVGPSSKVLMTRPLFCIIYYSITSSLSLQLSNYSITSPFDSQTFLYQKKERPSESVPTMHFFMMRLLKNCKWQVLVNNYSMISPFDSQTFLYQKKESFLLRLKSPVPSSCLST